MKLWILPILLLSHSLFAFVPEFPAEGTYKAKSYEVLLTVHHIVVPNMSSDAEQRILDLKSKGYGCVHTTLQMTKCSKTENVQDLPIDIEYRVKSNWFGFPLKISAIRSEPSITVDGESYQEWSMDQEVVFKGKSYLQYRLMVSDKIKKLAIGTTYAGAEYYFNYTNDNRRFQVIAQETKTISRFEFVGFLIAVNFE